MKKVWKIYIQESGKNIRPELEIPCTHITKTQLLKLIQILAAKYALNDQETVNSLLRKNLRNYAPLLEVNEDADFRKGRLSYSCGSNPYVIAQLREKG